MSFKKTGYQNLGILALVIASGSSGLSHADSVDWPNGPPAGWTLVYDGKDPVYASLRAYFNTDPNCASSKDGCYASYVHSAPPQLFGGYSKTSPADIVDFGLVYGASVEQAVQMGNSLSKASNGSSPYTTASRGIPAGWKLVYEGRPANSNTNAMLVYVDPNCPGPASACYVTLLEGSYTNFDPSKGGIVAGKPENQSALHAELSSHGVSAADLATIDSGVPSVGTGVGLDFSAFNSGNAAASPSAPIANATPTATSSPSAQTGSGSGSGSNTASASPSGNDYCTNFCSQIVGPDGKSLSLNGSGDWTAGDDLWCSTYGIPLLQSFAPLPGETTGAMITRATSDPKITANFPKLAANEPAITAGRLQMCTYHQNSQAMDHCLAFQAANGAQPQERTLMTLDMAATVTCGAACVGAAAAPPLITACKVAGTAVSVMEIISQFTMKNNGAGSRINALFAAGQLATGGGLGGLAKSAATEAKTDVANSTFAGGVNSSATYELGEGSSGLANSDPIVQDLVKQKIALQESTLEGFVPPDYQQTLDRLNQQIDAQTQLAAQAPPESVAYVPANPTPDQAGKVPAPANTSAAAKAKKDRNNACMSAAFFAIMSGTRSANIGKEDGAKAKECNSIMALNSSIAVPVPGATQPPVAQIPPYNVTPPGGGGTTGGGTSTTAGAGTNGNTAAQIACLNGGGTTTHCISSTAAAAKDAGVLDGSGLSSSLAPLAQNLLGQNPANLSSSGSGGGAGSGPGGGSAGNAAGEVKTALADLAQMAAHADGDVSGGTYAGGGGGGGSRSTASDSSSPFGNLFGNKEGTPSADGAPTTAFNNSGPEDIFHSKSNMSLFQIVSKTLTKVNQRVDHLDWTSPQNRALAGLPPAHK